MRRLRTGCTLSCLLLVAPAALLAVAAQEVPAKPRIVILPVQDRAGDSEAREAVWQSLFWELSDESQVVGRKLTRDTCRKFRIRTVDDLLPEQLRALAGDLDANLILTATIHDLVRTTVPRITISARVFDGSDGTLVWAGFHGDSGLDHRTALEYGVITEIDPLVRKGVASLLAGFVLGKDETRSATGGGKSKPRVLSGPLAIVPFGGVGERDATRNAETVTEAARAMMVEFGVPMVSPGCVVVELRRQKLPFWGSIDADARQAVGTACGAEQVLTGTVERYDVGGSEGEPEPYVAFGLRLLDVESGRIVWTGGGERRGWSRQGLFRLGRVYSRGALTESMMRDSVKKLSRARP